MTYRTQTKPYQYQIDIFKAIEDQFIWADYSQAQLALKTVLHTFRDRLTIEDAVLYGSYLPINIRDLYYKGWNPSVKPLQMNKTEFLGEVKHRLSPPGDENLEEIVKIVMTIVEDNASSSEISEIKNTLPREVAEILTFDELEY